jgi:hypothetical protein
MINALGTLVSQHDDPTTARTTVIPIWEHLLRSLRATGPRNRHDEYPATRGGEDV